jgi:hypothetical protein
MIPALWGPNTKQSDQISLNFNHLWSPPCIRMPLQLFFKLNRYLCGASSSVVASLPLYATNVNRMHNPMIKSSVVA